LKILLVSTGLLPSPPIKGGAIELHTYNLVNCLSEMGNEVHYLSDVSLDAHFGSNVVLHSIGSSKGDFHRGFAKAVVSNITGGYSTYKALKRLVSEQNFEIIHLHEKMSAYLFERNMKQKLPLVFTCHNPISKMKTGEFFLKQQIKNFGFEWLELTAIKKATSVITVSKLLKDELINREIDSHKLFYVPNGVDTSCYFPHKSDEKIKQVYGIPERYVLFTGKLEKRKGAHVLLIALKMVPCNLVIVGDGPEKNSLKALCKSLQIEDRVLFLSGITSAELREIYCGALFFVLPSLAEGLPLVMLEAMSSGLPVISSCNSAQDVIVDWDNGFIVTPNDVAGLADKMRVLLDNAALRLKMGHNARALMVQEFDWKAIASKVSLVYKETISS
jgi:glycosyltransferase involved in cell wall biosynthesis